MMLETYYKNIPTLKEDIYLSNMKNINIKV